jgi:hypothetical protein
MLEKQASEGQFLEPRGCRSTEIKEPRRGGEEKKRDGGGEGTMRRMRRRRRHQPLNFVVLGQPKLPVELIDRGERKHSATPRQFCMQRLAKVPANGLWDWPNLSQRKLIKPHDTDDSRVCWGD